MRKLILLFTLVVALIPAYVFADIYGTLSGKVVDADGKGVMGASVTVQGTTRGTKVNAKDGSFTVTNITAGSYTVLVRSVGMQEYKVNVRISADQTTKINVTLKEEAVALGDVVVVADRVSKVDVGTVGSVNTLSGDALTQTSATNMSALVGMSAGVSSSTEGYSIRGSRPSETQIRLDGMNMGNQFSGGFGVAGATYFPMASTYATEEVQVITGNFSAQYGDVQGGIVNSVMKTGRTDKYEGYFSFESDLPFLAGSQSNNVKLLDQMGQYRVIDSSGDGLQYLQRHLQSYDVGFGGPLDFIPGDLFERSTFYITAKNIIAPYRNTGYDLRDIEGNSIIRGEVDGLWSRNIEGRIALGLSNDIKLVLGGKLGLYTAQQEFSKYASDIGTPYINEQTGEIDPINGKPVSNGVSQNVGKATAQNNSVNNAFARINHTLTASSFYELTFSWSANNAITSRKVIGSDNNYFTGYELMEPVDNWVVDANKWTPSNFINGRNVGDLGIDWAQSPSMVTTSKDGFCIGTFNLVNPLTGYYEGERYRGGTENPYGMYDQFYMGGANNFELEYNNILSASGHYNLFGVKTGDFTHTLKAGFETSYFTMNKHLNSQPYSTSPIYDIYTDLWGGNIYAQSQELYEKTSKPMHQFKLAAYVQDQITFKGIVFNPGLRLDIMDPLNKYRIIDPNAENGLQFIPISSQTGFADATTKVRVSPRININYPITERSYVSMSYGQFFQAPLADNLYNYFNLEEMRSAEIGIGNPNMEAQQTNQYQVEYKNQLTEDFALSFAVYFKDIYNQLGVLQIQTTPVAYFQWAVSEYGSSKGIEIQLDKSLSDHFGFSINYTLSYLVVTASDANSNMSVLKDPYTGLQTFPLAPFYSNSDVRHNIKGYLFFAMGQDEGPEFFGKPFQNMALSIEPTIRSGKPYTKVSMDGSMYISDRNIYRDPAYWNVDAKLSKAFALKDWFGESMGKSSIEFWVSCSNIFNRRAATAVYRTTDDPLDDGRGLNYNVLGQYSSIPWYKEATKANPASYTTDQYDWYGNRLYNEAADFDGNGIVTQAEKYEAYKRYYEAVVIQQRSNYQIPITFRAGAVVRF